MQANAASVYQILIQDEKTKFALDFERNMTNAQSLQTDIKVLTDQLFLGNALQSKVHNQLVHISFANYAKNTLAQLESAKDIAKKNQMQSFDFGIDYAKNWHIMIEKLAIFAKKQTDVCLNIEKMEVFVREIPNFQDSAFWEVVLSLLSKL